MRYYVTADIHGFYIEFQSALRDSGYYEDPEPHKLMIYELRNALEQGRKFENAEEYLYGLYRKAGYEIYNADDQMRIVAQDKIHTTTCCTLLPFINEYTFDILPKTIYNANSDIIHQILTWVDLETLKVDLKRRKRTLPTNGVRVTFSGTEIISELLLKEILYDNSIYMLYRISTADGDLCGVYETKDCFCYSIFQTSIEHDYLAAGVESLVLFCYASQVLGGKYSLSEINRFISVDKCAQLTASCYGQGGRLRNVYDGVQPKREGDYVAGEASIQGYIRKLPAGQKASQEARELAESLGVRPGIERDLCSTVHPPGVPTERTQGIKRHFQVPERCLLKAAVFMLTALWGQNN